MTLEELSLRLDSDNDGTYEREYQIYPVQSVDIRSRKEAFSISPPGLAARQNILLGVNGMQADIEIEARLWDDGEDRADGTHSSTVVTVEEQIEYLEDVIQDPSFSAAWALDHLTGTAFNNDEVFVESIEPTVLSVDNQGFKPVRFTLRRGQSVG